jgi:hypothetical protein
MNALNLCVCMCVCVCLCACALFPYIFMVCIREDVLERILMEYVGSTMARVSK